MGLSALQARLISEQMNLGTRCVYTVVNELWEEFLNIFNVSLIGQG